MEAVLSKYFALTPKQRKEMVKKFEEVLNENEEVRKKTGKKTVAKFKKIIKLETERDTALYNKLRAWRNKLAESSGLDVRNEAWQIMKNDPLMNAAYYRPVNEDEFLRVDGMTKEYFESYGQDIINIIMGKNVTVAVVPTLKEVKIDSGKTSGSIAEREEPEELAEFGVVLPSKRFLPVNK